jgi:hypothetical protein
MSCKRSRSPPGQIPRTGLVPASGAGSGLLGVKSQHLAGEGARQAAMRAVKEIVAMLARLNADNDDNESVDCNSVDE